MNIDRLYPNITEVAHPLTPGTRIGVEDVAVLEVVQIAATLTIAGKQRPMFVAVHEKRRDGIMLTMFVSLGEEQRAWAL